MSVCSKLHAGEIECLHSRLVDNFRWLGVFDRDELPDLTRVIRPWCLILNTDPKDRPGTHWLALYAFQPVALKYLIHLVYLLAFKDLIF